ncbi:hypothetical protein D9M68_475200 [compost metagenome]
MVAFLAHQRAARVDDQAAFAGQPGDAVADVGGQREGLLAVTLGDVFDCLEVAQAAHIADERVACAECLQALQQVGAVVRDLLHQPFVLDGLEHRQRGGAGQGIAGVGIAVLEAAGGEDRLGEFGAGEHRRHRVVARAQALGQADDVGPYVPVLVAEPATGAADAGHHFVEDQQNAVAPADFLDAREVGRMGDFRAGAGAADRFGDEGRDIFRADRQDRRLQFVGAGQGVGLGAAAGGHPVLGRRGDLRIVLEHGLEGRGQRGVAGHRQGAHGRAVVGRLAADEHLALRLAPVEPVLAGDLQRRLHRLGATGGKEHPVETPAGEVHQALGEVQRRLVLELGAVGEGDLVQLGEHRFAHRRVAVAELGDYGPGAGVDVALAMLIPGVDAFGTVDDR